jgi:hypothetical protein
MQRKKRKRKSRNPQTSTFKYIYLFILLFFPYRNFGLHIRSKRGWRRHAGGLEWREGASGTDADAEEGAAAGSGTEGSGMGAQDQGARPGGERRWHGHRGGAWPVGEEGGGGGWERRVLENKKWPSFGTMWETLTPEIGWECINRLGSWA